MKTSPCWIAGFLLSTAALLTAQPNPGAAPAPEQRPGEPGRRGGPPRAFSPPGPRGEMEAPRPGGRGPQDLPRRPAAVEENFFPPELIMQNQQLLNLGEEQRKRIVETIQRAQAQFTDVQWQLEVEQASLQSLVRADRPDEKQVGAQLEKVLRLESEMRRGHLLLMVRLKNELTAEQQAKLRELRPRPGLGGEGRR
jgi:Spy/CpxP family protein refolding chaperone